MGLENGQLHKDAVWSHRTNSVLGDVERLSCQRRSGYHNQGLVYLECLTFRFGTLSLESARRLSVR